MSSALEQKRFTWSYSDRELPPEIEIENILKYGNIDDIKIIISKYGIEKCKSIWLKEIISDKRFDRLNYFLARFIFQVSTNSEDILTYIRNNKRKRFEPSS